MTLDERRTHHAELTSKYNRIVVAHNDPSLTLIGVRCRDSGQEQHVSDWVTKFPVVPHHPLQSIDDVIATFDEMDPLAQEGYVIVDDNFNRVKVKHPGYVAMHHVISSVSPKAFLEVVRSGESQEVLVHFPEHADMFADVKTKYDDLVSSLEGSYRVLKGIENQKEFALLARHSRHPGTLFQLRGKKSSSVRDSLKKVNIKQLMTLVGLKEAL